MSSRVHGSSGKSNIHILINTTLVSRKQTTQPINTPELGKEELLKDKERETEPKNSETAVQKFSPSSPEQPQEADKNKTQLQQQPQLRTKSQLQQPKADIPTKIKTLSSYGFDLNKIAISASNRPPKTPPIQPRLKVSIPPRNRLQQKITEKKEEVPTEQLSTKTIASPSTPPDKPGEDNSDSSINRTSKLGHSLGNFALFAPGTTPPSPLVKTKLTISTPGDKQEQQANTVAAQVVKQINSPNSVSHAQRIRGSLQKSSRQPILKVPAIQPKVIQPKVLRQPLVSTPWHKRINASIIQRNRLQPRAGGEPQELTTSSTASADLETSIPQPQEDGKPVADNVWEPIEELSSKMLGNPVQTKLKIGQQNDKHEQEADRVAEQVMQMPEAESPTAEIFPPVRPPVMQKMCSECKEELQWQTIQEEEEKQTVRANEQLEQIESKPKIVLSPVQPQRKVAEELPATEPARSNDVAATKRSLILWRFIQTKLDSNLTTEASEEKVGSIKDVGVSLSASAPTLEDEAHQIQPMCAECTEEGEVQRKPIETVASLPPEVNENRYTINANRVTQIPSDDNTVQAFSLEDVGNAFSSGAEWVGEQGENLLEMGAEAFMEIVERIAPGLAELIRNGPEGLLSEKIGAGIQGWLQNFLGDFDISSAVNNLQENLAGVFANIQGALAGDEASCAAFAEGIDSLRNLATAFMENPAVQAIQEAFAKVGDFLQQVSNLVLAPVFDALMEVAGGIFNGVTELASTIWEWGGSVRDFLGRAWDWVLEQLGIGGDSEGGILEWLQEKASAVWLEIKETFAPVIEPITKVLQVMVTFSPAGPFLAVVTYGPQLIEAVEWLWNNKDNPDIVRAAHEQMGNTILPQLLTAAQGFSQTLQTTVNSFVEQVLQIGEGVLEFLGAVTGVPLLSGLRNLVQSLSNDIQELVTWSQTTFQLAAEWVQNLFTKIKKRVEPYVEVLSSLGLAIVNPGMIPVILTGWAWRLLPDCYKAPIINFLLDTVIAILEATPSLPIFGLLWPIIKTGVIGFLQGVRNQDDETKVAITNKLAKIISGASLDFIFGFVKGFLTGLWEGLTDPFKLIYMAIKGLGNLIVWLNGVADQALSPTSTETESSGTADNRAVISERLPQMARELQPPVEQVTEGFMPAVEEFFSGGEGMSFEELIQKLGEAWDTVETAIRNAGNQLAEKVVEFLMQDSAEGSMGEAVGWLAGTIVFEVGLAILTAGTWTAASGAMKILKGFARVLDWTGEVLGVAFKALAKVGGFIIDGLKGLRKLLSNSGGAARAVLDALGEIGEKLIRFADELLGRVGKGATGEVVEETAEKAAKETAEVGAERAGKEAVEEVGERSSREAAEAGSERGAKGSADKTLEDGIVASVRNPDGHSIKILEDGRIVRCSSCEVLELKYKSLLDNDKYSDYKKLFDEINALPPGSEKATRAAGLERRLANLEEAQSFINRSLDDMSLNDLPDGYHHYIKQDGRIVISRVDKNSGYPPLTIETVDGEQFIREGAARSSNRISQSGKLARNLGGSIPNHEAHHLIPDAVVRDHELTQLAMQKGKPPYNLDDASNGIFLPSNADGAAVSPNLPLHRGSHPQWNRHAESQLDALKARLLKNHGTLEDVPKDVLTQSIKRIETRLRKQIKTLIIME